MYNKIWGFYKRFVMIPDQKNGYFQTMTYMIVSDTHNYDLVAKIKLILHFKKNLLKIWAILDKRLGTNSQN